MSEIVRSEVVVAKITITIIISRVKIIIVIHIIIRYFII